MERTKVSLFISLSHDLWRKQLKIDVKLPEVDEKNISLEMKEHSFCITAPRNGIEYSGCFLLDYEAEPGKTETKYEDGVFRIFTPFKGSGEWDRLREGYMGRPVIKG